MAHGAGRPIAAIMRERHSPSKLMRTPNPLWMNINHGCAMSLGVAFWVSEEMKRLVLAGDDADTFQGNDPLLLSIPATFVVGREGKVTAKKANVQNRC